ncbi:hypothetical protein [Desulfosporosinus sp. OT]|uniref:hypothetical protein n=1 Tax=Desulfosporosinus sp. OT TaxID=913865 RepID=UPI000223B0C1|nr:hypothetical protein [Desulfosporosinus sp. OT]EGW38257.1 hypothetical protein DOT_3461 [Desulfosporosinus sp. OT]
MKNQKGLRTLDRDDFAIKNGFISYEEMLSNSITIVYDYGISYFATTIHDNDWLAWIDKRPEQVIGIFETLEKAHERLFYVFAEKEFEQMKIRDPDHLC